MNYVSNQSLFGYIDEKGVVEGLTIENCSVQTNTQSVGAIATRNDGKISNCIVKQLVKITSDKASGATEQYMGGIVGYNTGEIVSCIVNVESDSCLNLGSNVSLTNYYVGGIAGYNKGKIQDCSSNIDYKYGDETVSITNVYTGGIVGANEDEITGCIVENAKCSNSSAKITNHYIGGICGLNSGNNVRNCNCSLYVEDGCAGTNKYIGGLIGYNRGTYEECSYNDYNDINKEVGYSG